MNLESLAASPAASSATIAAASAIAVVVVLILMVLAAGGFTIVGYKVGRRLRASHDAADEVAVRASPLLSRTPGWKYVSSSQLLWLLLGAVLLVGSFSSGSAEAANIDLRGVFEGELSRFVQQVMRGGDLIAWAWMIWTTLSFLSVFIEIGKCVIGGLDPESHIQALLLIAATAAIIGGYDAFTRNIWGVGEGVAQALQMGLLNNNDTLYIGKWMQGLLDSVQLPELGITGTIRLMVLTLLWLVVTILTQTVYWIGAAWALLGYAFAKIVGLVFVPFLALRATGFLFSGWFKVLLGSVALLITLKGASLIGIIIVKAAFQMAWGIDLSYGMTSFETYVLEAEQMGDMLSVIVLMLLSVIFVLSSFGIAGALIGGLPDSSRAVQNGLGKAAKAIATKLIL